MVMMESIDLINPPHAAYWPTPHHRRVPNVIDRRMILIGSTVLIGPPFSPAHAQSANLPAMRLNPPTLPPPVGFSHLSEGRGRLVWISGQVPRNARGQLVGEGDFAAQVEQVFRNLAVAVEEAGGRFADVVKLNYYCHESVDRSLLRHVNLVRDRHVDTTRPPASTFIFVPGLALPGWLIEIEAVLSLLEDDGRLSVHAALVSDAPISATLLEAARGLASATRAEPGCLSYHVGIDIERPSALRLSETWRDLGALRDHFTTPHMAAFREILAAEGRVRTEIEIFSISRSEPLSRLRDS